MITTGWLLIILGAVWPEFLVPDGFGWGIAAGLARLSLLVTGARLIHRGRQHTVPLLPSLQELPANQRVVLFLRSFKEDHMFSRSPWVLLSGGDPTPLDLLCEEDEIGRAFSPFGKMIALGSTSDRLPRLGSERHYASDGTWQAEVQAALSRSALVVLAVGAGRGLAWEVNELVTRYNPMRLVLLVNRDHQQYDQFRHSLGGFFPRGLPDYGAKRRNYHLPLSRYVRAAIWFDADWTPHWENLKPGIPLFNRHRTRRALPRALRKVYERARLPLRSASTVPRPGAVKFSAALISLFLLGPASLFVLSTFGLLSNMSESEIRERASGDPVETDFVNRFFEHHDQGDALFTGVAGKLFEVSFLLIMIALFAIFVYRVWQGGPTAVTVARIASVSLSFLFVPLAILAVISVVILNALSEDFEFHPVPTVIFSLVVAGWLNLPVIFWLLLKREVRDWVDSRL
ncbi:hypothetical protein ACF1BK_10630 [Streptomyces globisporus]|uniref:hypothetical protein n=1 Tax=Streptomyces globisporus TaxID=1908 RepID=UPI0036FF6F1B